MARPRTALPDPSAILALADAQHCLAIRATPNASADELRLPNPAEGTALIARTTATPENGKANEAILAMLAKALGQPKSTLILVRGAASRDKLVRLPSAQTNRR